MFVMSMKSQCLFLVDKEDVYLFNYLARKKEQSFWKLSNATHFLLVSWRNIPTWGIWRILEKLVHHKPEASDLQAFRASSIGF